MTQQVHPLMHRLAVILRAFLIGVVLIGLSLAPNNRIWAGPSPDTTAGEGQGDVERGKALFNGKGVCFYCHGRDGDIEQRPLLARDTADVIARLDPKPPDLRDRRQLKLRTDRDRFKIIREGHLGTGMLPDTSLSDEEIRDVLTYLAALRREADSKRTPGR